MAYAFKRTIVGGLTEGDAAKQAEVVAANLRASGFVVEVGAEYESVDGRRYGQRAVDLTYEPASTDVAADESEKAPPADPDERDALIAQQALEIASLRTQLAAATTPSETVTSLTTTANATEGAPTVETTPTTPEPTEPAAPEAPAPAGETTEPTPAEQTAADTDEEVAEFDPATDDKDTPSA